MNNKNNIGIIGFGNMASSIIEGTLNKKIVNKKHIFILAHNKTKDLQNKKKYGISICKNLEELTNTCSTIVLGTKPQQFDSYAKELSGYLKPNHLIISIMAGISTSTFQKKLSQNKIIRVMPNTPIAVGFGMTGLYATKTVSKTVLSFWEKLFSSLGRTLVLKKESEMHTLTAISGSGPAFIFEFCRSLIHACQKQGFTEKSSTLLVQQTLLGAAQIWTQSNIPITELISSVTSKGGTTEAGLKTLNKNRLEKSVTDCVKSAVNRSKQLAK